MTRRERIGTLVVAFLLALSVITVYCVKSCARNTSIPADMSAQIQEFKQQVAATDSLSTKHQPHKKSATKSTSKKDKEHKNKTNRNNKHSNNNSPRRFDDLPTF